MRKSSLLPSFNKIGRVAPLLQDALTVAGKQDLPDKSHENERESGGEEKEGELLGLKVLCKSTFKTWEAVGLESGWVLVRPSGIRADDPDGVVFKAFADDVKEIQWEFETRTKATSITAISISGETSKWLRDHQWGFRVGEEVVLREWAPFPWVILGISKDILVLRNPITHQIQEKNRSFVSKRHGNRTESIVQPLAAIAHTIHKGDFIHLFDDVGKPIAYGFVKEISLMSLTVEEIPSEIQSLTPVGVSSQRIYPRSVDSYEYNFSHNLLAIRETVSKTRKSDLQFLDPVVVRVFGQRLYGWHVKTFSLQDKFDCCVVIFQDTSKLLSCNRGLFLWNHLLRFVHAGLVEKNVDEIQYSPLLPGLRVAFCLPNVQEFSPLVDVIVNCDTKTGTVVSFDSGTNKYIVDVENSGERVQVPCAFILGVNEMTFCSVGDKVVRVPDWQDGEFDGRNFDKLKGARLLTVSGLEPSADQVTYVSLQLNDGSIVQNLEKGVFDIHTSFKVCSRSSDQPVWGRADRHVWQEKDAGRIHYEIMPLEDRLSETFVTHSKWRALPFRTTPTCWDELESEQIIAVGDELGFVTIFETDTWSVVVTLRCSNEPIQNVRLKSPQLLEASAAGVTSVWEAGAVYQKGGSLLRRGDYVMFSWKKCRRFGRVLDVFIHGLEIELENFHPDSKLFSGGNVNESKVFLSEGEVCKIENWSGATVVRAQDCNLEYGAPCAIVGQGNNIHYGYWLGLVDEVHFGFKISFISEYPRQVLSLNQWYVIRTHHVLSPTSETEDGKPLEPFSFVNVNLGVCFVKGICLGIVHRKISDSLEVVDVELLCRPNGFRGDIFPCDQFGISTIILPASFVDVIQEPCHELASLSPGEVVSVMQHGETNWPIHMAEVLESNVEQDRVLVKVLDKNETAVVCPGGILTISSRLKTSPRCLVSHIPESIFTEHSIEPEQQCFVQNGPLFRPKRFIFTPVPEAFRGDIPFAFKVEEYTFAAELEDGSLVDTEQLQNESETHNLLTGEVWVLVDTFPSHDYDSNIDDNERQRYCEDSDVLSLRAVDLSRKVEEADFLESIRLHDLTMDTAFVRKVTKMAEIKVRHTIGDMLYDWLPGMGFVIVRHGVFEVYDEQLAYNLVFRIFGVSSISSYGENSVAFVTTRRLQGSEDIQHVLTVNMFIRDALNRTKWEATKVCTTITVKQDAPYFFCPPTHALRGSTQCLLLPLNNLSTPCSNAMLVATVSDCKKVSVDVVPIVFNVNEGNAKEWSPDIICSQIRDGPGPSKSHFLQIATADERQRFMLFLGIIDWETLEIVYRPALSDQRWDDSFYAGPKFGDKDHFVFCEREESATKANRQPCLQMMRLSPQGLQFISSRPTHESFLDSTGFAVHEKVCAFSFLSHVSIYVLQTFAKIAHIAFDVSLVCAVRFRTADIIQAFVCNDKGGCEIICRSVKNQSICLQPEPHRNGKEGELSDHPLDIRNGLVYLVQGLKRSVYRTDDGKRTWLKRLSDSKWPKLVKLGCGRHYRRVLVATDEDSAFGIDLHTARILFRVQVPRPDYLAIVSHPDEETCFLFAGLRQSNKKDMEGSKVDDDKPTSVRYEVWSLIRGSNVAEKLSPPPSLQTVSSLDEVRFSMSMYPKGSTLYGNVCMLNPLLFMVVIRDKNEVELLCSGCFETQDPGSWHKLWSTRFSSPVERASTRDIYCDLFVETETQQFWSPILKDEISRSIQKNVNMHLSLKSLSAEERKICQTFSEQLLPLESEKSRSFYTAFCSVISACEELPAVRCGGDTDAAHAILARKQTTAPNGTREILYIRVNEGMSPVHLLEERHLQLLESRQGLWDEIVKLDVHYGKLLLHLQGDCDMSLLDHFVNKGMEKRLVSLCKHFTDVEGLGPFKPTSQPIALRVATERGSHRAVKAIVNMYCTHLERFDDAAYASIELLAKEGESGMWRSLAKYFPDAISDLLNRAGVRTFQEIQFSSKSTTSVLRGCDHAFRNADSIAAFWKGAKEEIGDRGAVALEAKQVTFQGLGKHDGLIDILLEEDAADVFESEAIQMVVNFKWRKFARPVLLIQVGLHVVFFSIFHFGTLSGRDVSWLSVAFAILFCCRELHQCAREGIRVYFVSPWNWIEAIAFTMALASHWVEARWVKSVSSLLLGLDLINYLRAFPFTSPLVSMVAQILQDMLPFLVLQIVVMTAFGFALAIELPHVDEFQHPISGALALFQLLMGGSELELYDTYTATAFFVLYNSFTVIVLLNLLIAIMGDSYDRIREFQETEGRRLRASVVRHVEKLYVPNSMLEWDGWFPPFLCGLIPVQEKAKLSDWKGRLHSMKALVESCVYGQAKMMAEIHNLVEMHHALSAKISSNDLHQPTALAPVLSPTQGATNPDGSVAEDLRVETGAVSPTVSDPSDAGGMAGDESLTVESFLCNLGLKEFVGKLEELGVRCFSDLAFVDDEVLREAGFKLIDRKKFMQAIQSYFR